MTTRMKNITIQKIAEVCAGTIYGKEWINEEKTEAAGVVLDSRLLKEGYVFI